MPLNCGITVKINDTYYGSIIKTSSGYTTNKMNIYKRWDIDTYLSYNDN